MTVLNGGGHGINGLCTDIKKSTVQMAFGEVFGYELSVNPSTYGGLIVEKSEENAKHDGRVISGPGITSRSGYVYERLINNETDSREVVDLRACVVGAEIPFVYIKKRSVNDRFSNDNNSVHLVNTETVFDESERVFPK